MFVQYTISIGSDESPKVVYREEVELEDTLWLNSNHKYVKKIIHLNMDTSQQEENSFEFSPEFYIWERTNVDRFIVIPWIVRPETYMAGLLSDRVKKLIEIHGSAKFRAKKKREQK